MYFDSCKLTFDGTTRLVVFDKQDSLSLSDLSKKAHDTYKLGDLTGRKIEWRYNDSDGDEVVIRTNEEFLAAWDEWDMNVNPDCLKKWKLAIRIVNDDAATLGKSGDFHVHEEAVSPTIIAEEDKDHEADRNVFMELDDNHSEDDEDSNSETSYDSSSDYEEKNVTLKKLVEIVENVEGLTEINSRLLRRLMRPIENKSHRFNLERAYPRCFRHRHRDMAESRFGHGHVYGHLGHKHGPEHHGHGHGRGCRQKHGGHRQGSHGPAGRRAGGRFPFGPHH